jgi:hypothetical protein
MDVSHDLLTQEAACEDQMLLKCMQSISDLDVRLKQFVGQFQCMSDTSNGSGSGQLASEKRWLEGEDGKNTMKDGINLQKGNVWRLR